MSSQGGFDIGDIFNVQNNYLQTLNSQSKEFSTIDGSSQVADYVKNIQNNLQKTSKTYDDANTSSAAVLTEQEKMKEILEDEQERLERKEQLIKNAKTMQERKALFADTQRQEYGAYTRIMLIVILALIIHILLRWGSNMLGENKSSGMNTVFTLLHIVNFAVCGIIIIFMYMNLSVRSDINYNHIEMPPPNEDEFESSEQQPDFNNLFSSLGICYEETCCGDETRWDSEQGTCISITADVPTAPSGVNPNTDTSALSNATSSGGSTKVPAPAPTPSPAPAPSPAPSDINTLIKQQLDEYNNNLINIQEFYSYVNDITQQQLTTQEMKAYLQQKGISMSPSPSTSPNTNETFMNMDFNEIYNISNDMLPASCGSNKGYNVQPYDNINYIPKSL